ncbi:MAG: hypothetical protein M1827_002189 [Pycnora praestabilis]|nr:MAG: hypothetical protein M1827_002189 [Pycnora praestabilis]
MSSGTDSWQRWDSQDEETCQSRSGHSKTERHGRTRSRSTNNSGVGYCRRRRSPSLSVHGDYTDVSLPCRSKNSSDSTRIIKAVTNIPQWPPLGLTRESEITFQEAEDLIRAGASNFQGYCEEVPHSTYGHYHFFATVDNGSSMDTDCARFQCKTFNDMSLALTASSDTALPWLSLEQPSMASCFGTGAGTVSLNHWVGSSGSLESPIEVDTKVRPRKITLIAILGRLQVLESGLEEEDHDLLYENLYHHLIRDPEENTDPHYGLERQISDLITVLSRSDWTDFSHPKNQVVARFFMSDDQAEYHHFFLQLLLSVELHLRIHSSSHTENAKKKLLPQLPPKVAWDLAVAQRWLENMAIETTKTSSKQSVIKFNLRSKNRQIEALRDFAWTLKWPNMTEIEYILEEKDSKEMTLEDRSYDAMSWFTGVILPGITMPWLLMNSLIDCDRDTGDKLNYLTHMYPNSGFQYRANTYWSWECIVGKVLGAARGVHQIAGWIGPCFYSPDLKRIEVARIYQKRPKQKLSSKDVDTMAKRSDPTGPLDSYYPADDYELLTPDTEDVTDAIRMEKLNFAPRSANPKGKGPLTFDAAVTFAIDGRSWPLRLRYDVNFIAAHPCRSGPHVLFYDFAYRAVKVDDIVDIHNWGNASTITDSSPNNSTVSPQQDPATASQHSSLTLYTNPMEAVLVIEAFGVSDNEVFARAWCSHWGVSAITANINRTCMACAIREAYAGCLSVVILTQGGEGEEVEEVDRRF